MNYCGKCGAKLEKGAKFCPSCGEKLEKKETIKEENVKKENTKKETVKEETTGKDFGTKVGETFTKLTDTADSTSEFDAKDINDNKGMACLSYLGPLVFIPYFAAPNSKYAKFHAKEGLNFLIYWAAFWVLHFLLSLIKIKTIRHGNLFGYGYDYYVMATPIWIWLPLLLVELAFIAVAVIGVINAVQGKAKELPIFGKIKIIK